MSVLTYLSHTTHPPRRDVSPGVNFQPGRKFPAAVGADDDGDGDNAAGVSYRLSDVALLPVLGPPPWEHDDHGLGGGPLHKHGDHSTNSNNT